MERVNKFIAPDWTAIRHALDCYALITTQMMPKCESTKAHADYLKGLSDMILLDLIYKGEE